MEVKLIKLGENDYILHVNNRPFAYEKLSLKNCQAIENGYDLDELAKLSYKCDPYIAEYLEQEFKRGFQKALEILGDKKFSEYETYRIWKSGQEYWKTSGESITFEELIERRKELLQQNEWYVTFNPDELDKDGCLILKRK